MDFFNRIFVLLNMNFLIEIYPILIYTTARWLLSKLECRIGDRKVAGSIPALAITSLYSWKRHLTHISQQRVCIGVKVKG